MWRAYTSARAPVSNSGAGARDGWAARSAIRGRWRELHAREEAFLRSPYRRLSTEQFSELTRQLTHITTSEIEPRHGFSEGHIGWRTDPLAIALIFGMRTLEEIEEAFPNRVYGTLNLRFVNP